MPNFSRREMRYRRKRKRSKFLLLLSVCILIIAVAAIYTIKNHSIYNPGIVPADTSGNSPVPSGINDIKLTAMLWTPPRVDSQVVPLTFCYETNKPGSIKVNLQIKVEGDKAYKDAAIQGSSDFIAASGMNTYSFVWDKSRDGISIGQKFDIRIQINANDRPVVSDEIRNVHFETREAIRDNIQNYLINYGTWTDEQIDLVKQKYQLVIVDARNITTDQVQRLRAGKNAKDAVDDVLVLGYISVGEDSRTAGMTPEEMKKDPRFVLDGTGPSVDPRIGAPYPNGGEIPDNIDILGKPTNGGFAPFYLNDNFINDNTGGPGVPDINKNFKAAFVNPGHPEWLKVLKEMALSKDKVSGIKELLSSDCGAGFGCDGLFLDTLDTAAPNSFTDSSSSNPSEFEWAAKGTQQLVSNIRQTYPDKFLLANRGLFFYNPDISAYKFTLRGLVDFVLFESYRLDNSASVWFNESFFNDNKYNYAQKLLAEADRSDGFRVLSLGYAEGPDGESAKKALHGEQNSTVQQLLDDVKETSALGMLHYISNTPVTDINTFVLDNEEKKAQPPVWGNTKTPIFGNPYDGAREGLQKVVTRGKDVFVQWDVAHSMARPVIYSLYIKAGQPFDFNNDLESQSRRIEMPLGPPPTSYAGSGDRTDRYPYEAKVDGLESGKTYYLLLRAKNALGQYENNTKEVKIAAP